MKNKGAAPPRLASAKQQENILGKTKRMQFTLRSLGLAVCGLATAQARETLNIDAALHPLNESLLAVWSVPESASAMNRVPACVIVHGSGGLFRENDPGEDCDATVEGMENNFATLMSALEQRGVAALAPSSFASRDARFCEDNDDDYFQFVAPPLHNPGDGVPARDTAYKIRRILTRTLDVYAATQFLCQQPEVDCQRLCLIGTSNGGSAVVTLSANDLGRHLAEFADGAVQRKHESNGAFADRSTALMNYPALPAGIESSLQNRPLPRFTQAISPGCGLRNLIPNVTADEDDFIFPEHLNDLYYPAAPVELHLDIGQTDDVPDQCHGSGLRAVQAADFEALSGTQPSRYLPQIYPGAGHNLVGENTAEILDKLNALIDLHFYPPIFANGFETEN